jgi:hypothetical protein
LGIGCCVNLAFFEPRNFNNKREFMNLSKLFGKKTFPHGIHLEEHKAETNAKPTRRLPFAPEIIVPMW